MCSVLHNSSEKYSNVLTLISSLVLFLMTICTSLHDARAGRFQAVARQAAIMTDSHFEFLYDSGTFSSVRFCKLCACARGTFGITAVCLAIPGRGMQGYS